MAFLSKLGKYNNAALLIMRLGLGFMMILHGYPKLSGGAERWEKLGGAMSHIGIKFMPVVWGFMAAITETVGGLFFLLGLFFRPTSFLLFFTMLVAAAMHLGSGDTLMDASHAVELCIVFLAMIIIGPGKYAVDKG